MSSLDYYSKRLETLFLRVLLWRLLSFVPPSSSESLPSLLIPTHYIKVVYLKPTLTERGNRLDLSVVGHNCQLYTKYRQQKTVPISITRQLVKIPYISYDNVRA